MIYQIEQNKWYCNTTREEQYYFITTIPCMGKFIGFEFLSDECSVEIKIVDPTHIYAKMIEKEPVLYTANKIKMLKRLFNLNLDEFR